MRTRFPLKAFFGSFVFGSGLLVAQPPTPPAALPPSIAPTPPGLLPPSITGRPVGNVTPVASTKLAPSIERFEKNPRAYPAETLQCVQCTRAASAWLVRMNQSDGRFLPGVNPALARPLDSLNELNQAYACWGLCRTARFTGDDKIAACASQAVLALLTLTKTDAQDAACRVPTVDSNRCNRVGLASILVLCIHELPNADAALTAEAGKLAAYLRKQLRADGSVQYGDGAEPATKTDPDGVNDHPGLCFQALLVCDRLKPAQWHRDALAAGMKYYREWFKTHPNASLAGTLLPAVCEQYLRTKTAGTAEFACELADHVCGLQVAGADTRELKFVGSFRVPGQPEPIANQAALAESMVCAATVASQIPDPTRYTKYRTACTAALAFHRGLQFTEETTAHFEKSFRAQFLLGGVCTSHSSGNVRCDQTAMLALACIRYLESGAEKGE